MNMKSESDKSAFEVGQKWISKHFTDVYKRQLLTMLSTGGEEFAIPASDKSQRVALKEQPEVAPERQRLLIETGGLTAVKIGHPDVRPSGEVQSRQAPAEAGIPRRRWGIALLLGIGVLVNYIDRVNLSVAQPALHAEFGITAVTFGWLLGAYSWTYALLQLPSGVLPVSYTHLDVYKRQGRSISGPRRGSRSLGWMR